MVRSDWCLKRGKSVPDGSVLVRVSVRVYVWPVIDH